MEQPAAKTCATCGAELRRGDDFCLECGHSVAWSGAAGGDDLELDGQEEELPTCPKCLVGQMRSLSYGHPQCESCGYMDRP